jgi:hypothetical protein
MQQKSETILTLFHWAFERFRPDGGTNRCREPRHRVQVGNQCVHVAGSLTSAFSAPLVLLNLVLHFQPQILLWYSAIAAISGVIGVASLLIAKRMKK